MHPKTFEQRREEERERKHSVALLEQQDPTPPTPEEVTVEDGSMFDLAEYKKIVAELGVDDSAVRNQEFRQFLHDEGITVYPYEKVTSFLDEKIKRERKAHKVETLNWLWKPALPNTPYIAKDPNSPVAGNFSSIMSFQFDWISANITPQTSHVSGERKSDIYSKAIPYAVLLSIKKLKDKFLDKVNFYVSDYEVRDPDPFLLVTGPGLDYYVIERWDEPSFRS